MPDVGRQELAYIGLWQRCKRSGALPCPGAALEQPALLMEVLDTVEGAVEAVKAKRLEDERGRMVKTELVERSARG